MTFLDALTFSVLLGAGFYKAAMWYVNYLDQKQPLYRYVWQQRRM